MARGTPSALDAVPSDGSLEQVARAFSAPISWHNAFQEAQSLEALEALSSPALTALTNHSARKEDLTAALAQITRFTNSEMIRGVPLGTLLSGMGQLFGSSVGNTADYRLSKSTDHIQDFISHNWSLSRWRKFLALSSHYNLPSAVLAMYSTAVLVAILTASGRLPLMAVSELYSLPGTIGFWSLCLSWLALVLALCCGNVLRCAWRRPRLVFLDKACIPQRNKALRLRAIRGLAAFLSCSERMVAVYSDVYLQRLWTVYEVASFLTLRGPQAIVICDVWASFLLFLAPLLLALETMVTIGIGAWEPQSPAHQVLARASTAVHFAFSMILYSAVVRLWLKNVHCMLLDMQSFSIREARCHLEEDRKYVKANICVFMKSLRKVPEGASLELCLNAFDEMVRERLPEALSSSFGRNDYTKVVVCTAGFLTYHIDEAASRAAAGMGWPAVLHALLEGLLLNLGMSPLIAWLMARRLRHRVELTGLRELCFVAKEQLVCLVPFATLLFAPIYVSKVLAERLHLEKAAVALSASYACLLIPLAVWVLRPGKDAWEAPTEMGVSDDEELESELEAGSFSL